MSGFYLCHMEEWGNFILEKEGLFLCFTVICCWQTGLPPHWCHPCHHQLICWAHPKGNQSWMFTGRTDAEAETPILWPPDVKNWLNWKRPWCWERLKAGGERDYRGWDGWMASPTQWTWFGWTLGVGDGQGSLACCSPWGRKESDMTEWLNWTELIYLICNKVTVLYTYMNQVEFLIVFLYSLL